MITAAKLIALCPGANESIVTAREGCGARTFANRIREV
jgi:hypothetical protein